MKSAFRNLNGAVSLLTTLPTPNSFPDKPGRAYAYFPLVGVLVGTVLWAVGWISGQVFPAQVTSIAVLLTWIVMTGGLHLDGFGDACDGLFAVVSVERRLEIMKDSRIGAYGVLALILVIGLKWLALATLIEHGALWAAVLVPAMLSRAAMTWVMATLPFAREDGLAHHVGQPSKSTGGVAIILAAGGAIALSGLAGVAVILTAGVVALALSRLARAKIGGQTGDVLGATQQLTALAALLALVTLVSA